MTFWQELTYIIKQDIAHINKQIASLQTYVKQRNGTSTSSVESKQIEEHTNNVVMLLQSKLANTSVTFKDVLEVRTQVRRCLLIFLVCSSNTADTRT
jgi:syntaxin 5